MRRRSAEDSPAVHKARHPVIPHLSGHFPQRQTNHGMGTIPVRIVLLPFALRDTLLSFDNLILLNPKHILFFFFLLFFFLFLSFYCYLITHHYFLITNHCSLFTLLLITYTNVVLPKNSIFQPLYSCNPNITLIWRLYIL